MMVGQSLLIARRSPVTLIFTPNTSSLGEVEAAKKNKKNSLLMTYLLTNGLRNVSIVYLHTHDWNMYGELTNKALRQKQVME